jgi:hypothetical protein
VTPPAAYRNSLPYSLRPYSSPSTQTPPPTSSPDSRSSSSARSSAKTTSSRLSISLLSDDDDYDDDDDDDNDDADDDGNSDNTEHTDSEDDEVEYYNEQDFTTTRPHGQVEDEDGENEEQANAVDTEERSNQSGEPSEADPEQDDPELDILPSQRPKKDGTYGEKLCYRGHYYLRCGGTDTWKCSMSHVHFCKIRLYTSTFRESGITTNGKSHLVHKPVFELRAKYELANSVKEQAKLSDEKSRKIIIKSLQRQDKEVGAYLQTNKQLTEAIKRIR